MAMAVAVAVAVAMVVTLDVRGLEAAAKAPPSLMGGPQRLHLLGVNLGSGHAPAGGKCLATPLEGRQRFLLGVPMLSVV